LEKALADLKEGGGAALAAGEQQLEALRGLRQQIDTASPGALAALKGNIVATAAAARTAVTEAQTAAKSAEAAEMVAHFAEVAAEAKAQADSFMRDFHKYDHLMHFDSPEERDRVNHCRGEIEDVYNAHVNKGTPKDDTIAVGAAAGEAAITAHYTKAPGAQEAAHNLARRHQAMIESLKKINPAAAAEAEEEQRKIVGRMYATIHPGSNAKDFKNFLAQYNNDPAKATEALANEPGATAANITQLSTNSAAVRYSYALAQPVASVEKGKTDTPPPSNSANIFDASASVLQQANLESMKKLAVSNVDPAELPVSGVVPQKVAVPSQGKG
jgi:hypothetical protein